MNFVSIIWLAMIVGWMSSAVVAQQQQDQVDNGIVCTAYLNSAHLDLPRSVQEGLERALVLLRKRLRHQEDSFPYANEFYSDEVPSRERLNQIFDEMSNPQSPQRVAMRRLFFGRSNHKDQWGLYLSSCYEQLLISLPEYWEMLIKASSYFHRAGDLAVLGTGPGSDMSMMVAGWPDRRVIGYDNSPMALDLAYSKMMGLVAGNVISPWQFRTVTADITKQKNREIWDGALMNNVLYALPNQQQVLRAIYEALRPGGILVLNNPIDKVALSEKSKIEAQRKILGSSLAHGSTAGEIKFATALFANIEFTVGQASNFFSASVMRHMLREAGFSVLEDQVTFLGHNQMFVAVKNSSRTRPSRRSRAAGGDVAK